MGSGWRAGKTTSWERILTSIQTNMAGTFPRCTSCVLGMYCITGMKFVLEHCPTCGKHLRLISLLSDESPQQVYEFETTWDWEKKTGITIQTPEQLGRVLEGKSELPPLKKNRIAFDAIEVPSECCAPDAGGGVFVLAEQRCCECATRLTREKIAGEGLHVLREHGGEFSIEKCSVTQRGDGGLEVELDAVARPPAPLNKIGLTLRLDDASQLSALQPGMTLTAETVESVRGYVERFDALVEVDAQREAQRCFVDRLSTYSSKGQKQR